MDLEDKKVVLSNENASLEKEVNILKKKKNQLAFM